MMNNLLEILSHVDPARCSYTEWTEVGMALKEEGYSISDWDAWSSRDAARYNAGECNNKWRSFNGSAKPVTGGTIFQLAIDQGWTPASGEGYDWDDEIQYDGVVVDHSWLEGREVVEPDVWNPAAEIIRYLETLFEAGENVGYVMQSYKNDKGKYIPQNKGSWDRTAGELIEQLSHCNGDIGSVFGDYNKAGGAWIRFNPLDGQGVRNENVADFRYALVESDNMELDKQNAILRELELPIAVLLYSGGKSLHAIVRVEAADYSEYRKRVDYLYEICEKNGMEIDKQNKNPSRLSRMPGIERGDNKQYIIDTNLGKRSWSEWKDWIEGINDDLPDMEELKDIWSDMPKLAPCLIDGVLRNGHKMLIAGPSKAGKSFLLIMLTIAIAEGKKWLNWQCSMGKVLYVNLELDRASCLHRFKDVYTKAGIQPAHLDNIDIWNLRGRAVPMDKLAPKLIRRAQKKEYRAIIIDPIYKVITGDENSADQMAKFCNQFDLICTELKCAVIYCHHHSKGSQGQKKATDRASGSGVFARDPDALLDMIELETTEDLIKQETNKAVCHACKTWLEQHGPDCWKEDLSQDDLLNSGTMLSYCQSKLDTWGWRWLQEHLEETKAVIKTSTAWRIEGTLREFPRFEPVNLWFRYPVHVVDTESGLQDIKPEDEDFKKNYQRLIDVRKEKAKKQNKDTLSEIEIAFEGLVGESGMVPAADIAEEIGVAPDTLKRWFGKGKRGRPGYQKLFETFEDKEDGGKLYIRKRADLDGMDGRRD